MVQNPINFGSNKKETKTERPWGSFEILCKGPGYQSKRLTVKPKSRLSLQTHKHRDEEWVIISSCQPVLLVADGILTAARFM